MGETNTTGEKEEVKKKWDESGQLSDCGRDVLDASLSRQSGTAVQLNSTQEEVLSPDSGCLAGHEEDEQSRLLPLT